MTMKLKTSSNPTLDANGRFTVAFSEFQKVTNAIVSGSDGYVPSVYSISVNVVTVEVRRTGGHAHAFRSQGLGGAVTNALGLAAGLNSIEDAGAVAVHTVPGGGTTGVQTAAATALAACGAGAIAATFRVMAEGI
jgi:hypothetical protein